mmetsp:Transcript_125314/g.217220  ORF Transcript_125314/g.217220 Transcript_125314/m.217220 type:complete len:308 (+) Transcript_125314:81-1004(+)
MGISEARHLQQPSQDKGLDVPGVELNGRVELRQSSPLVPSPVLEVPAVGPRLGIGRVHGDGRVEVLQCPLRGALVEVHHGPAHQRAGEALAMPDREIHVLQSAIQVPGGELALDYAPPKVGIHAHGVQEDGLVVVRQGGLGVPQSKVNRSPCDVPCGLVFVQGEGFVAVLERQLTIAVLELEGRSSQECVLVGGVQLLCHFEVSQGPRLIAPSEPHNAALDVPTAVGGQLQGPAVVLFRAAQVAHPLLDLRTIVERHRLLGIHADGGVQVPQGVLIAVHLHVHLRTVVVRDGRRVQLNDLLQVLQRG